MEGSQFRTLSAVMAEIFLTETKIGTETHLFRTGSNTGHIGLFRPY